MPFSSGSSIENEHTAYTDDFLAHNSCARNIFERVSGNNDHIAAR